MAYADEIHALETILARERKEKEALAAHVERLIEDWDALAMTDAGTDANRACAKDLTNAFCDTPETSLARLIAEKQAEACEHWVRNVRHKFGGLDDGGRDEYWRGYAGAVGDVEALADRLRRQAEEPNP